MNRELYHHAHRRRRLVGWILFYILLALAVLAILYYVATQIRTHTLPVGQIQLDIPHSQYLVGETVTFEIKNYLNAPVYVVNKCPGEPLAVYIKQNGIWVRVHDQANAKDCPAEDRQVSIAANSSLNGSFAAWHQLFHQPGLYRVVAVVEHYNALPYQDFEVITPPPPAPIPTPIPTPRPTPIIKYIPAPATPRPTPLPPSWVDD